jgi:hypothetical protein
MDDISSQIKKEKMIDGAGRDERYWLRLHPSLADKKNQVNLFGQRKSLATLFSRGKISQYFFTEDSHRYLTYEERFLISQKRHRFERLHQFDSVFNRYAEPKHHASERLYADLKVRYRGIADTFLYLSEMLSAHISPVRVWNASIVGAIFFGMFSMTLIYRYLGQQVSAEGDAVFIASAPVVNDTLQPTVLGVTNEKSETNISVPITPPATEKSINQKKFEEEVADMVKDYPIEEMLPYIFEQDRDVATYLIAIGKKESAWGKRVPVLNGGDCYNYWGYRGVRDKMGTGGHTCFDSREDAVKTVGKRIKTLLQDKKLNTPAEMVIWKCGSSCAGHKPQDVRKWISDVQMYVDALQ